MSPTFSQTRRSNRPNHLRGAMEEPPSNDDRTALYRLYDADGRLLYVGITNRPDHRWMNHAYTKTWWHLVSRKEVIWYGARAIAEKEERQAVRAEAPLFDATHRTGGNWRSTARVSFVDPRRSEIVDELRSVVQKLAGGQTLPPRSDLASRFGTSIPTIDFALGKLGEEKMVHWGPKRRWHRGQAE